MTYLRPKSLNDALEALADGRARVAAGCTDLFPATHMRALGGAVVDITDIKALRGIRQTTAGGWRIGAASTWADVARADLPPACRGLQLAAREVGAKQIQNRATVAGNLCNASPAADGVPALLTLDAEVEVQSAGATRRLPLARFIQGPRKTDLRAKELVTAIHIPETATGGTGAFLKLGARDYLVISIVMAALRIEIHNGLISQAALAVGACGPVATRLPKIEEALIGTPPNSASLNADHIMAALSPIDDLRANAAYRSRAAVTLLRRAMDDFSDGDPV